MRLQGELTIDSRLNSLLDAPSEAKAIEAFHLLWESTLVTKVRPFLLSRQIHADVCRDIEVETCLRVCQNLLQAIARDLAAANPGDRPFLRYYSLVNLHNNPEVDDKRLICIAPASASWSIIFPGVRRLSFLKRSVPTKP